MIDIDRELLEALTPHLTDDLLRQYELNTSARDYWHDLARAAVYDAIDGDGNVSPFIALEARAMDTRTGRAELIDVPAGLVIDIARDELACWVDQNPDDGDTRDEQIARWSTAINTLTN